MEMHKKVIKLFEKDPMDIIHLHNEIINHYFIQEMKNDVLSADKFAYYMENNIPYLERYTKCSSFINKIIHHKYKKYFKEYTDYCSKYTKIMNEILSQYNPYITGNKIQALAGYTQHLIDCCSTEQVEIAMGAFLPCEWVFMELGQYFNKVPPYTKNSYSFWIDPLIDIEYVQRVESLLDIFTELYDSATTKVRYQMLNAFYKSTFWELRFFDDAYKKQVQ